MLKEITHNRTLIAIVGDLENLKLGNNFITNPELNMQVGVLKENKKVLRTHIHKVRNRNVHSISNEFCYVVRGSIKVKLYDYSKEFIDEVVMPSGTFCVLYNGGHGFEILEDNSLIIEVKAGAFTTVEDDKIFI